jgi:hypothetical protein
MQDKIVSISISKNEAWKLIDAIKSYQKDYALTGPTNKIFDNLTKKLNGIISN